MNINKAAILISKASLEFEKVANPVFAECDMTASQYRIFEFLYASELRTARVVGLEERYSMTHAPKRYGVKGEVQCDPGCGDCGCADAAALYLRLWNC